MNVLGCSLKTALLALLACYPLPLIAQKAPPVAPVREVQDKYFGQTVNDPYRWMENETDPELAAYLKAQNDYTRSVLATILGREKLLKRINELDRAGTQVFAVQRWGEKYFYYKTEPGADIRKLYVRDGLNGPERLLVDPEKLGTKDRHYAIDFFRPSLDGKYVGYGLSAGGSENSTIYVVDANTGRVLPDAIDRCLYSYVAWHPDNKSFFYFRMNKIPPDAPASRRFKKLRAYQHTLGTDPDSDPALFGYGLSKAVQFGEDDWPVIAYSPASPYLFALAAHGVRNEVTLYAAPLGSIAGDKTPWHKIVDTDDEVTDFDIVGDDVYLLTHKNASRFKIVKTPIRSPDFSHASVVAPPGKAVITALAVAKDGLYYKEMDGGISRIRRVPLAGGSAQEVPLPFAGAVLGFFTHALEPGILIYLTGWTKSPVWVAYDPADNRTSDTGLAPPWPLDFSAIESVEVKAKSADGTMVPLSIIHKRGLRLDGSHPTMLGGYGAYGISIEPNFLPTTMAWLERGGVLAFAHVRGGGEYGEDWHHGGMKATKMNTIADFIACAQYLVEKSYTSPARLAGTGTSAGGILIGGALTQRPDLFAVVLSRVGVSNALRFEVSQGGPSNVPEFGTVSTPDGFKALYAMDAYHHVRPKTPYPAVMLTTGLNDPRVPVWQVSKMAARLQASTSSNKPILLRMDYDAGHGLGSTKSQLNLQRADEYSFLLWQLGDSEFQPTGAPAKK